MTNEIAELNERIDEFVEKTKAMEGAVVEENPPWNTGVNADQARHYLNGIGDINPRWDPDGPGDEVQPTYLSSVMYPMLHGEPMEVPLSSLIAGMDYRFHEPIRLGDDLDGTARIKSVFEKGDPEEKRYVFVISEVTYTRNGEEVATAEGTMIRATQRGTELLEERDPPEYSGRTLDEFEQTYEAEIDRLETVPETPDFEALSVGDELPTIVRGPLTIADMVCWNAGRGPTYGANVLNYRQRKNSPHNTVTNPKTGWMQKTSHQHEDVWLCDQRGMPLPFANGVMMWAWTSPLVTNWMGESGFLVRHEGNLEKPYYYGDVLWLDGEITDTDERDAEVAIEWEAINQDDESVLTGESAVRFPNQ